MVSEPLDERRLLQAFQVILGGEITQNLLSQDSSVWAEVFSGAKAELPFENSTVRYSPAQS